ncbi:AIPR family protein, partial [Burkholderia thailandensis]
VPWYKAMIAKAIVFKSTQKIVRPMFQAFQANIAAYVVAVLADRLGDRIELDRIWSRQALSPELCAQIARWAKEVSDVLHQTAGGRMVSEWAKKPECRDSVLGASFSMPADDLPELL